MQQLPTMLGLAVEEQEQGRCVAPQCWKSCPNGSNIAALRFGDHRTNCWDLLVQMFDSFEFEQQFPTTRNNMQKQITGCTYGRDMLHPTMLGVVGQQCCASLHRVLHIVSWYCRVRALEKQVINSLCHSGGLPNISVVSLLRVFCQNPEV